MHFHNKETDKNNNRVTAAITIFTVGIIFASTANVVIATTSNTTGLELSPQLIWDEVVVNTGATPINETHTLVTFIGNGTMIVPDTGQTINMTNNGYAIISPMAGDPTTISASGREAVFSEDGDTSAITLHEIVRYDPDPPQGKGIVIVVFDRNATGTLVPFNGMIVTGIHDEPPNAGVAIIKLWEWQSGIPIPTSNTAAASING
ncbi:MAG TPA: hypothetical protein VE548_06790 [Nitrososphaeraceae archaeon]|nr:hypothetical protein [Nitrososphaeraceae archaeon]